MSPAQRLGLPGKFALFSLWLCLTGCGGLGISSRLPFDAQTIEAPPFLNKAAAPGMESELARQLSSAINTNGRLRTVETGGDLRLSGEIQYFRSIPVRRDASNQPVQFKMILALDMELTDLRTNVRLWTTHRLVHLTPAPEGHVEGLDDEAYDSLNASTLKISQLFWGLNQVGQPVEDPAVVGRRLLKEAADKVLRKILTGFYGGSL